MNKRNRIILVSGFLLLLTVGLFFDTFNKINQHGWSYEVTYSIGNEVTTNTVNNMNSLKFCFIAAFFLIIELSLFFDY